MDKREYSTYWDIRSGTKLTGFIYGHGMQDVVMVQDRILAGVQAFRFVSEGPYQKTEFCLLCLPCKRERREEDSYTADYEPDAENRDRVVVRGFLGPDGVVEHCAMTVVSIPEGGKKLLDAAMAEFRTSTERWWAEHEERTGPSDDDLSWRKALGMVAWQEAGHGAV